MLLIASAARIRSLVANLAGAEDRPHMKRIDASPALPDDGLWLEQGR